MYIYIYLSNKAFDADIYMYSFAQISICSYAINAHSIHVMTDGHIPFTLQSRFGQICSNAFELRHSRSSHKI